MIVPRVSSRGSLLEMRTEAGLAMVAQVVRPSAARYTTEVIRPRPGGGGGGDSVATDLWRCAVVAYRCRRCYGT
jgi:hypothetical protein